MSVDVGEAAPKFDLPSDDGSQVRLSDFEGKWLVLYFYPRDNTPGCTREAQDFTEAVARLRKLGAEVVGVSRDSIKSHCGFRDKYSIGFRLLSDPDLVAHRAYDAWGIKTMYGKKVEGTIRSTFLIAPDGTVHRSWKSVKVNGHVDQVIEALSVPGSPGASAKSTRASSTLAKKSDAKRSTRKTGSTKKANAKRANQRRAQPKKKRNANAKKRGNAKKSAKKRARRS